MTARRESAWDRTFAGSSHNTREEKVLEYAIHRVKSGGRLEDVVKEPYVRRTCSQAEVDEVINDPRLIHAARESMGEIFNSGELDPKVRA